LDAKTEQSAKGKRGTLKKRQKAALQLSIFSDQGTGRGWESEPFVGVVLEPQGETWERVKTGKERLRQATAKVARRAF